MHPNPEMTDFNYKKYSLENLENWLHDAMSAGEASPQEIYDVIRKVVEENYYHYKHHASQAYELLSLLNGNNSWTVEDVMKEKEYYEPSMPPWGHSDLEYAIHHKEPLSCDKDDPSPECQGAWDDFWTKVDDRVTKWLLPVQQSYVDGVDDYYVNFPDDLLEAANLKEGDKIEWVDNKDGSYTLRKV